MNEKYKREASTVQVVWVSMEHFPMRYSATRRVSLPPVSPQRALWKAICENKQLKESNKKLKGIVIFLMLVILVLILKMF